MNLFWNVCQRRLKKYRLIGEQARECYNARGPRLRGGLIMGKWWMDIGLVSKSSEETRVLKVGRSRESVEEAGTRTGPSVHY